MIAATQLILVMALAPSRQDDVSVPQPIRAEIERVLKLSNNGDLPPYWRDLEEEQWSARYGDDGRLKVWVGGRAQFIYNMEQKRIVLFVADLPWHGRPPGNETIEAMRARVAAFDRAMGHPEYAYETEVIPPLKLVDREGNTQMISRYRFLRRWAGNPIPYHWNLQSWMILREDGFNISSWNDASRSLPPIGPPPAVLSSEDLTLAAAGRALEVHPDCVAVVLEPAKVYLSSPFRRSPLEVSPGWHEWARPITSLQRSAQVAKKAVYLAEAKINLRNDIGQIRANSTVTLDPTTGKLDQIVILPVQVRGNVAPRLLASPSPGEMAWLSRDGVRSQVRLTEASSSEKPRGLPVGVLMVKDTARRVEIDPRANVLWMRIGETWKPLGWQGH